MSANEQRRVVVELHASHRATMEPVVAAVRDSLLRSVIEFGTGGPLGHTMELVISDEFGEVVRRYGSVGPEVQTLPQGLVPEVVERLRELGQEVEVRDRRTDSDRWRVRPDWKRCVEKAQWEVVSAVGEHRALRVVGFDDDTVADAVANVTRAYPDARIAIAVPTNALLDRVRRRLGERLVNPLGLFTAKKKRPGRVSVGLVGQFPRQSGSEWDLLVLPYAEGTVSDAALRVIASGQYQRLLSFSRAKWTRDESINRRFLVIAGSTFPEERTHASVTAVVLPAHGTRPDGVMPDALQEKKKLYWHNGRRNRRVAEVARCLVKAKKKSVRSIFNGDEPLVKEVVAAAKSGVAVVVETPVHAREFADLLPGWVIWTANGLDVAEPEPGCGIITTETAATQYGIGAGVLIRATGTRWALPEINWPSVRRVESAVLIDFADEFHPQAAKNAAARTQSYQKAGMTVWTPEEVPATEHHETTGASG
ncbi:hypothetical protein [Frigoriglobus tundricola]|uniref:Uncharacterized protein n=1 Tax=Frigoriglobus tundricola TaxID=2774151 RepID=A0A6M5YKQ3_9BACT|nr:hypothetical protein [Frigoriglobus tundricola]QJW94607.1 hypothetical protein FTUN_2129 [Frigoriglobus tundricola]